MRIKFTLKVIHEKVFPLNFNYPLSAAIYYLLRFGSEEFSEYLHNIGFQTEGKTYKLFSFGIQFKEKVKVDHKIFRMNSDTVFLYVTSPLVDKFLNNLLVGSFTEQQITLFADGHKSVLQIEHIETLPEPVFENKMKFIPISPLVIGTKRERNNRLRTYYLRYYDDINEFSRIFNQNLINKYALVTGKNYEGDNLKFNWDTNYIDEKLKKNKKVTRLINNKIRGTIIQIKANEIPFTLEGNKELIKIGYECGFGSQNSLGCGLVEVE